MTRVSLVFGLGLFASSACTTGPGDGLMAFEGCCCDIGQGDVSIGRDQFGGCPAGYRLHETHAECDAECSLPVFDEGVSITPSPESVDVLSGEEFTFRVEVSRDFGLCTVTVDNPDAEQLDNVSTPVDLEYTIDVKTPPTRDLRVTVHCPDNNVSTFEEVFVVVGITCGGQIVDLPGCQVLNGDLVIPPETTGSSYQHPDLVIVSGAIRVESTELETLSFPRLLEANSIHVGADELGIPSQLLTLELPALETAALTVKDAAALATLSLPQLVRADTLAIDNTHGSCLALDLPVVESIEALLFTDARLSALEQSFPALVTAQEARFVRHNFAPEDIAAFRERVAIGNDAIAEQPTGLPCTPEP